MNYLVTLNVGNAMCDNVRHSYEAACSRWGIRMYEITYRANSRQDICFSKIMGIRTLINEQPDVRGVLYLDADMLIRDDTPNPFAIFSDRKKVYMVKDFDDSRWNKNSESFKCIKDEVSTPWIGKAHGHLRWSMKEEEIENCTDWFVNAGFFLLYIPESSMELDLFIANAIPAEIEGRYEQGLWNYILRVRKKVQFIPSTWNRINPEVDDGMMHSYIYHFTGIRSFIYKEKISTYRWNYANG